MYATEAYYEGPDSRVRRFVYRKDGLVSVQATDGSMTTRPLTFSGKQLVLNYRARPRTGSVRVEIQDAAGKPLAGFGLSDCRPLLGDQVAGQVSWKGQADLGRLSGVSVRVKFVIKNADLFSLRFR